MQILWEYLESVGGTIDYPNVWLPPKLFQHDVNLSEFIKSQKVAPHIQHMFNVGRLHKKVYYLGDLLEPNGTRLRPHALNIYHRKYHDDKFPETTLPPRDSKFNEVWQIYIRMILQVTQLGKALGSINTHSSYEWCLDSTHAVLIRYKDGEPISNHHRLEQDAYNSDPSPILYLLSQPTLPWYPSTLSY